MTKTPGSLQDLSTNLFDKAKAEPNRRFWGPYVHVCKRETLQEAYQMAKKNNGAFQSRRVPRKAVAYRQARLPAQITFCVRGVSGPVLSNLYLNEVDKMLEKAGEITRYKQYTAVQYARFAGDLVASGPLCAGRNLGPNVTAGQLLIPAGSRPAYLLFP